MSTMRKFANYSDEERALAALAKSAATNQWRPSMNFLKTGQAVLGVCADHYVPEFPHEGFCQKLAEATVVSDGNLRLVPAALAFQAAAYDRPEERVGLRKAAAAFMRREAPTYFDIASDLTRQWRIHGADEVVVANAFEKVASAASPHAENVWAAMLFELTDTPSMAKQAQWWRLLGGKMLGGVGRGATKGWRAAIGNKGQSMMGTAYARKMNILQGRQGMLRRGGDVVKAERMNPAVAKAQQQFSQHTRGWDAARLQQAKTLGGQSAFKPLQRFGEKRGLRVTYKGDGTTEFVKPGAPRKPKATNTTTNTGTGKASGGKKKQQQQPQGAWQQAKAWWNDPKTPAWMKGGVGVGGALVGSKVVGNLQGG